MKKYIHNSSKYYKYTEYISVIINDYSKVLYNRFMDDINKKWIKNNSLTYHKLIDWHKNDIIIIKEYKTFDEVLIDFPELMLL